MRILYCLSNCRGSRIAEQFLTKHSYEIIKKNLSYEPIKDTELLDMDSLIPNGVIDLINPHSWYIVENKISYKNLSKRELIDLIIKNPQILSYPILLQTNGNKEPRKLIVGFNDQEWLIFEKEVKTTRYYNNLSKLYKFNNCCYFDEVNIENYNKTQNNGK